MTEQTYRAASLFFQVFGVVVVLAGGFMWVGRSSQALAMLTKMFDAHVTRDEAFQSQISADVSAIKGALFPSPERRK